MNDNLDKKLYEKYPKLFKERYSSAQETCMCWGFECGDGWYNILDALCSNIQHHVSWARRQRASALIYNRVLERAYRGDVAGLEWYHKSPNLLPHILEKRINESLDEKYRYVPAGVQQVVVEQVKEKFGALRFYYRGGDDEVRGMVRMAESMSAVTCEECGVPGTTRHGGWIKTRCDAHHKE